MHFQRKPAAEVKLVNCIRGAIYDVILDLRKGSPTYLRWQAFELSAENRRRLYIPAGYAHGFQTLSDHSEVEYLISEFYVADAASGVRYDDPAFAIEWPLPVSLISDRDRRWQDYVEAL
jgi:dTDP-4-dehydrorhamnose 3,5-epimerase